MTTENKALTLSTYINILAPNDQIFAKSLLESEKKYGGWTTKQAYWVDKLIQRGEQATKPQETTAVGDVSKIFGLFASARANGLSKPCIRLADRFKLTLAPDHGKNAGQVYVKQGTDYIGKINAEGRFVPGMNAPAELADRASALVLEFASNPLKAANAYGFATNNCCFCGRTLTDAESVNKGYGPICAERFGLVHNAAGHMLKVTLAA